MIMAMQPYFQAVGVFGASAAPAFLTGAPAIFDRFSLTITAHLSVHSSHIKEVGPAIRHIRSWLDLPQNEQKYSDFNLDISASSSAILIFLSSAFIKTLLFSEVSSG